MKLLADQKYDATTENLFAFAGENLPKSDLKLLAKAYLLGSIVRNGDMHAKNFSVMVDLDGNSHITPVYDMINTEIYGFDDVLALKLANNNRPKASEIATFLSQYLSPDEIAGMGQDVKNRLSDILDYVFRQDTAATAQKFKKRLEQSISGGATRMIQAAEQLLPRPLKDLKEVKSR